MKFWENSLPTHMMWYRKCQKSHFHLQGTNKPAWLQCRYIALGKGNFDLFPPLNLTNYKAQLSDFPAYLKSSREQLFITAIYIYIATFNRIYLLSPIAFCFHTKLMQEHFATYWGFLKEFSIFPYVEIVVCFLSKFASSCFTAAVKVCTTSLPFAKHPEKLFGK